MFLERDAAVVKELSLREQEETDGARALRASTWLESSASVALCPKQYRLNVVRLKKQDAEDHGIVKPSQGEKLVAVRANAYERREMAAVASVSASITQCEAIRRAARN